MLVIDDSLDAIFLGCLLFGLVFSALSLLVGAGHVGLGHGHLLGGHHAGHHAGHTHGDLGKVNVSTLLAFVAWFGGVGYLARHGLGWFAVLSVGIGLLGGLVGAAIVCWFLVRVILPADQSLDPADYRLPGTIAQVTSSIRLGGTGEIVYVQGGVRQVSAARSTDGNAIGRGAEVVIVDATHGVAYVQPWDVFIGDRHEDLLSPGSGEATGTDVAKTA